MFTHINPLHLSKIWYTIKPGIEELLKDLNKDCPQELWTPEDVYTSIKTGESVLLLSDDGFAVVQIQQDKYTGTKKLFIWLGYSFNPQKDVLENNQQQMEQLGRYYGCELMSFNTHRLGFYRRAKDLGFSTGITTFTKRL
jgi:hypothetical protein